MSWSLPQVKKKLDDPKCTLGDAAFIIGELIHEVAELDFALGRMRVELRERAVKLDDTTKAFHFEVGERSKVVDQLEAALEELHERAEALDESVRKINEGSCQWCGCMDPLHIGKWGGYFG